MSTIAHSFPKDVCVYTNDSVVCIPAPDALTEHHYLVLPKSVTGSENDTVAPELMVAAHEIAIKIKKAFNCKGHTIYVQHRCSGGGHKNKYSYVNVICWENEKNTNDKFYDTWESKPIFPQACEGFPSDIEEKSLEEMVRKARKCADAKVMIS